MYNISMGSGKGNSNRMNKSASSPSSNKGEKSEIYSIFKAMERRDIRWRPINEIKQGYGLKEIIYKRTDVGYDGSIAGNFIQSFTTTEIINISNQMLSDIKTGKDFTINGLDKRLSDGIKLSAKAKDDVYMRLAGDNFVGYSIKSFLGGAPTLLNASQSTNIIYELSNTISDISSINSQKEINHKLKLISEKGGAIEEGSYKYKEAIFLQNLIKVDPLLPEIWSSFCFDHYHNKIHKLDELIINYNNKNNKDCTLIIKTLLEQIVTSFTPTSYNKNSANVNNGMIIVKKDGSLEIIKKDEVGDYLMMHTKLDTSSTSRNKFGNIYSDKFGKQFFNLNSTIRLEPIK